MSEAIKSISLDDIGGLQSPGKEAPKPNNVMYNPQYGATGDQFQTITNASSEMDQKSDLQPLSNPDSSFGTSLTRMTELFGKFDGYANSRNYVILGALVLALAAALFLTSGDGTESPLSKLLTQFDSMLHPNPETPADDLSPENSSASPTAQESAQVAPPVVQQPAAKTQAPTELVNPYWSLPNPLETFIEATSQGTLTPSQEERWRQGLAHPFIWQRHKTVMEMRAAHLKGSQFLLNDALAQPKFWTRMEALLALAEMGETPDIDTVESGIGSTRRPLIQNYFRRFHKQSTGGELYIMRQAIRIVDAGTRKIILESLVRQRNPTNDLYLLAATYDPNPRINAFINEELASQPIADIVKERFQKVAAGMEDAGTGSAPAAGATTPTPNTKVQDLKVEQLPADVNVEEVYFLKDEEKAQEKRQSAPADDGFQQLEKRP